ncbi:hypothetical protein Mapa_018707 [Marchantia paleacea]|nr:hypothetical protein Mapa_018707 [Marchantia paleacea]
MRSIGTAQAAGERGRKGARWRIGGHIGKWERSKAVHHGVSFSHVKPHLVIQASKASEAIVFYRQPLGRKK